MSSSSSLIPRHSSPSPKITFPNPSIKTRSNANPSSRISFTNLRFTYHHHHHQLRLNLKVNGIQTENDGGGNGGGGGYGSGGWGEDDKGRFGIKVDRILWLYCGVLFHTLIYWLIRSDKKDVEEVREQREPVVELKITTKMLDEYRRFRSVLIKALNLGEEFMVEELTDNIDSKAQLVQLKCGESANLTVMDGEVRELNTGDGGQIEILFPHGGKLLINHIKSEEK